MYFSTQMAYMRKIQLNNLQNRTQKAIFADHNHKLTIFAGRNALQKWIN